MGAIRQVLAFGLVFIVAFLYPFPVSTELLGLSGAEETAGISPGLGAGPAGTVSAPSPLVATEPSSRQVAQSNREYSSPTPAATEPNDPVAEPASPQGGQRLIGSPGAGAANWGLVTNEVPPGWLGPGSPPAGGGEPEPSLGPGQVLAAEREPVTLDPGVETEPDLEPVYRQDVPGKVGLSFDDGPYPGLTEEYLEVLTRYQVTATFFVVGERVRWFPDPARQVTAQGSEIGSHSQEHARLDQEEMAAVLADLQTAAGEIERATGQQVRVFRPPYGRHSEALLAAAGQVGQRVILWSVDPRDWEDPPPERIAQRVLAQARDGAIIILHEGHKNTLEALPAIITGLRKQQLEPVPVSRLLAGSDEPHPAPEL